MKKSQKRERLLELMYEFAGDDEAELAKLTQMKDKIANVSSSGLDRRIAKYETLLDEDGDE